MKTNPTNAKPVKRQADSSFDFWRVVLKAGLPFGVIIGVCQGFSIGVIGAIKLGLFQGLIFGWLMALIFQRFARSERLTKQRRVDSIENEPALYETSAGHIKLFETRGGRLFLTPTKLIFKPHAFNLQRSEVNLSLVDIKDVSVFKTLMVFDNGLKVDTLTSSEKFTVNENLVWSKKIAEQIQHLV